MLACARIGAVHSVVFGGFSATSIKDRLADSGAKIIVTADGGWRRGTIVPLKANVDAALADGSAAVRRVIVLRRTENAVELQPGRDVWWHDEMADASPDCPAEAFESEHPLFILYTSGSTGRPKGILHTTAGYLLGAYCTTKYVFDLREEDVYWCTADVGWITGHSYVVYGPLANGATTFLYEGAPNQPEPDRWWQLIARHKISILYTAPTAIRAFIKWGDQWPEKNDLSSLRLLGTVGEPINPEAWMWFREKIGGGRCPIVDTWWQTETGAHMITPLPGAIPTKPGTATRPFFGVDAAIVDDDGNEVGPNIGGKLVIRQPWPSMLRTIYGDPERYQQQYWSEFGDKGYYFTGDGARRDEAGNFWIVGRIDDVLNVAGHRLGTSEIESALVSHPAVAEAAVVGRPDEIKGQGVVAFVTLKASHPAGKELAKRCAGTWARRSARSPSPTRSASRTRCPRRAAARSCGACSRKSPAAKPSPATRRRWRIYRSWRSCRRRRIRRFKKSYSHYDGVYPSVPEGRRKLAGGASHRFGKPTPPAPEGWLIHGL